VVSSLRRATEPRRGQRNAFRPESWRIRSSARISGKTQVGPDCMTSPFTHQANDSARHTAIWDQCGVGDSSQTDPLSLECAMEGWRDDWVALPRDRTSTDPGGLHQQPVLVPSLWGGSGPRHPRDAQSPRRVAPPCHALLIASIVWTSSRSVTSRAARYARKGAPAGSSTAWWGVNSRDWAGRLGLPRSVTRPHANPWGWRGRAPVVGVLRWRLRPQGASGRCRSRWAG
jgi:hypothetical protein